LFLDQVRDDFKPNSSSKKKQELAEIIWKLKNKRPKPLVKGSGNRIKCQSMIDPSDLKQLDNGEANFTNSPNSKPKRKSSTILPDITDKRRSKVLPQKN
jgi:hypothetical protein